MLNNTDTLCPISDINDDMMICINTEYGLDISRINGLLSYIIEKKSLTIRIKTFSKK